MKNYLDLLKDILENGEFRKDRTGVGTISVFGRQLRFDLRKGFPALTTKKLAWKSVVSELLWFLEGSHNEHRLAEIKNDNIPYNELTELQRKTIWSANYENQGKSLGYVEGELGPIYGKQWRDFNGIDQINDVIEKIKNDPYNRRLLVSAWNAKDLSLMALPPCHYCFQFYVSGENKEYLSLIWNQRSVDSATGLPFNIASYALLLCIISKITNKIPKELIGNLGDTHIYKNHIDNVKIQIEREPYDLPTLVLPNADYSSIDNFLKSVKMSDFILENYKHHDSLRYPMAV